MDDFTTLAAALAPLKVIGAPNAAGYGPGKAVLQRVSGERRVARANTWYIYDNWELRGVFRDKTTDEDLDAFITRAWARLSGKAIPDSFESEYDTEQPGNWRIAIVRFTTIRKERIYDDG